MMKATINRRNIVFGSTKAAPAAFSQTTGPLPKRKTKMILPPNTEPPIPIRPRIPNNMALKTMAIFNKGRIVIHIATPNYKEVFMPSSSLFVNDVLQSVLFGFR
ncbi:MAG: hypothetical protein ACNI3A_08045 [Desulfovibrio sp.]|uniref:hypothetical protein n=1 Tax=Desulfovibrio sp. 7SRBS1 TaxID=3378064 RepID=UPI003B3D84E9